MDYEEDLSRLENIVERLLESIEQMKQANQTLEKTILEKERENQELKIEVERLQKDKSVVHKRVTDLIGSIESWEKAHTANVADSSPDERPEDAPLDSGSV